MEIQDEIRHLSELSRVKLDQNEIQKYDQDLSAILDYVKDLNEAPQIESQQNFQNQELKNISRQDVAAESLSLEKVLKNAPETAKFQGGDYLKVEKVFS